MNPSYDLGHRTRVPGYHDSPGERSGETVAVQQHAVRQRPKLAFPEFFTEMIRNHGKGPNFGEKPLCFRCVVRCILYIRIWIYF